MLLGCSDQNIKTKEVVKPEITDSYLQSTVPYGYMIYNVYSFDLDKDYEEEYIVLYQETNNFSNSERVDLPRTLAAKISVQDYRFGQWQSSNIIPVVSDYSYGEGFTYQYFDIPNGLNQPITFHENLDQNLFAVYSYNGSFSGKTSTVTIFKFNELLGLEDIPLTNRPIASHGTISKDDKAFFIWCNPFDSDLINESSLIFSRVDLSNSDPNIGKYSYDRATCNDLFVYGYDEDGIFDIEGFWNYAGMEFW